MPLDITLPEEYNLFYQKIIIRHKMKLFKRLFVVSALLLSLTFSLCACNTGSTPPDDPPPSVSYGTATVNYHYEYDVVLEHYYQEKYSVQTGKSYELTTLYTPPMKAGYRFLGWTTENGGAGDVVGTPYLITGSGFGGTVYNFYAKYEAITFDVVYHLDGGTNNASNPTSLTGKQALKNPTKDKHKFLGWYRDPDFEQYTSYASMTDDVTTTVDLYAKWQRVYDINYVSDQPKVKVKGDQSYYHYTSFTEDDAEFTIELEPEYFKNYMFLGWECEEGAPLVESTEITVNPKETNKDLTFTAHYYQASNPANTKGLGTLISYGHHKFYAQAEVEKIIVEDMYGSKQDEMTRDVTVYYSGETPPEVICREGVSVTLIQDAAEVEKWFS